jgi:peptide/nickel transport system substrate-binding protein
MRGLARPAGMLIEPPTIGYTPELDRRLPHDPRAARELLSAAGYASGFSVTLETAGDSSGNAVEVARPIVEQLGQVGIRVTLSTPPLAELNRRLAAKETDFYLLNRSAGTNPDGRALMEPILGPNSQYKDARIQALLQTIPAETVTYARDAMIHEVWKIATDDIATIPLHHRDAAVIVSERLQIPSALWRFMWLAKFA